MKMHCLKIIFVISILSILCFSCDKASIAPQSDIISTENNEDNLKENHGKTFDYDSFDECIYIPQISTSKLELEVKYGNGSNSDLALYDLFLNYELSVPVMVVLEIDALDFFGNPITHEREILLEVPHYYLHGESMLLYQGSQSGLACNSAYKVDVRMKEVKCLNPGTSQFISVSADDTFLFQLRKYSNSSKCYIEYPFEVNTSQGFYGAERDCPVDPGPGPGIPGEPGNIE